MQGIDLAAAVLQNHPGPAQHQQVPVVAAEIGKRFERVTPALVAIAANVSHTLKSDALSAAIEAGKAAESAALDRIAVLARAIEDADPATGKAEPVTHDAAELVALGAGMTTTAKAGKGKAKRAAA